MQPTENNKFITLDKNEVMIDPALIETIAFEQTEKYLWSVTIFITKGGGKGYDASKEHSLYYGDHDLWLKAQKDFSKSATLAKH